MSILTIEQIIEKLNKFWGDNDCILVQPIDTAVGAGTFHPATFIGTLGTTPLNIAYVQPTRRPQDSKFNKHSNKAQFFHQYQVLLKPPKPDILNLYLQSLKKINLHPNTHDIKFLEDNWKSPTLAAWGVGWEVRANGLEISQITYFQNVGGLSCKPISVELTYGIERIALIVQKKKTIKKTIWKNIGNSKKKILYGDLYYRIENEMSSYNMKNEDIETLLSSLTTLHKDCIHLLENNLVFPALDVVSKLSHIYNLLETKSNMTLHEKQRIISNIRYLAALVATTYSKTIGY